MKAHLHKFCKVFFLNIENNSFLTVERTLFKYKYKFSNIYIYACKSKASFKTVKCNQTLVIKIVK